MGGRVHAKYGPSNVTVFLLVRLAFSGSDLRYDPPAEYNYQRAEESGDQILKGDLQIAESKVDSEQLKYFPAQKRTNDANKEVRPAAQTLLFQSHHSPRKGTRKSADNDPHDNLANAHLPDAMR